MRSFSYLKLRIQLECNVISKRYILPGKGGPIGQKKNNLKVQEVSEVS